MHMKSGGYCWPSPYLFARFEHVTCASPHSPMAMVAVSRSARLRWHEASRHHGRAGCASCDVSRARVLVPGLHSAHRSDPREEGDDRGGKEVIPIPSDHMGGVGHIHILSMRALSEETLRPRLTDHIGETTSDQERGHREPVGTRVQPLPI